MRTRLTLCILGLCAASLGCEMGGIAAHNLAYETALKTDNALACLRDRCLASMAWKTVKRTDPTPGCSKDYIRGFKDGFADYLHTGGCGRPAPLPPRHSWLTYYRRTRCHKAADDWLAGFQFGAATAQARVHRKLAAVPSPETGPLLPPPTPMPGPGGIYLPPPPPNVSSPDSLIEPELLSPTPLPLAPEDPQSAAQPPTEDEETE